MDTSESDLMVCAHNDLEKPPTNWNNLAQQALTLKQLLHASSDIDAAKICSLKEEIAAGRYEISHRQIAKKILADLEQK